MSYVTRYLWRRSERIVPCRIPVLLVAIAVLMLWAGTVPAEIASPACAAEATSEAAKDGEQTGAATQQRPKDRPAAIRALAARLKIGEGNAVADIGAGKGGDTWVFAEIVGPSGVVYSEEITENQVKSLRAEAEKRKMTQVRPVLGRDDSPALPPASVDLAYMRLVYHHFSKPREMLREIWRALKPGGYFVVVDRLPGTLRDWVPREQRKSKHFWLAETTVVREAREEGFRFVACADELCEAKDNPFVLIFQRSENQLEPGSDPDPFLPLAVSEVSPLLLSPGKHFQRPAIVHFCRQLIKEVGS